MSDVVYHMREHPRSVVDIEAECLIVAGAAAGDRMSAISVTNISIGGCQVRAEPGYLTDGCEVAIRFGDFATVRGMVCWSSQMDVGVRFFERLSPALLRDLVETKRTRRALRSVA